MKKYIMDCDPGHDDAIALILAAKHLHLLGITTVGGNQTIEKVTTNALKILEVIKRTDIPVYPGSDNPWIQKLETAPQFHGVSGLDGPQVPAPTTKPQAVHAAQFIVDTVKKNEKISLIATGPLTNLATALQLDHTIAGGIKEIFIMGGSVTFGNWTPATEFNIYVDPEAAYKVFNAGIPIRLCGLNLTRQAFVADKDLEILKSINNQVALFCHDLLRFFIDSCRKTAYISGANLHDVCAVAWAVDERLIKSVDMHVQIELQGKFTRGMTVCDYRHLRSANPLVDLEHEATMHYRGEKPNCAVGVELDVVAFFSLLYETIKSY
ncbi:MAG: nucleoside hydrolase [Anaerolineaceae bacterium]|nr:MAG: nucleoside hydrolase [Anaerolineaceae bacterium]